MSSTPQFGTAEYKSASGSNRCKSCQRELSGTYYRINGMLACENCTRKLQAQTPKDSHSAYVRGILFGVGGAIAGLILYSAFGIITGIEIGYVALAVGWLVGTAIKKGSNQFNELKVVVDVNSFSFYINGTPLPGTITPDTSLTGGQLALLVSGTNATFVANSVTLTTP